MKKNKWLFFELMEEKPKTGVWMVRHIKDGTPLGIVKWYCSWRQYCFFPLKDTLFSAGCMQEICLFIEKVRK